MLSNAARHLDKANQLQDGADEVLREVNRYTQAGEVDNETNAPPGDIEESVRLLALHSRLVEKATKHIEKARRILERV